MALKASFIALSSRTFNTGTTSYGPYPVPDTVTSINVVLDRDGWDFSGSVVILIEYSPDGTTWKEIGGLTSQCGPCTYNNNPVPTMGFECVIPPGTNRLIRGNINVTGTLRTAVTIKAY